MEQCQRSCQINQESGCNGAFENHTQRRISKTPKKTSTLAVELAYLLLSSDKQSQPCIPQYHQLLDQPTRYYVEDKSNFKIAFLYPNFVNILF